MKSPGISRTLILLKPDAIRRQFVGEILQRFERKGFKIVASEMRVVDEEFAAEHYAEHKGNPGYHQKMVDAITSGPLMAVVLEAPFCVEASRQLIGYADPLHDSPIGTIRADLAIDIEHNLVHGSDSNSAAKREITMWFGPKMWTGVKDPEEYIEQAIAPPIPKKVKKATITPYPTFPPKFYKDFNANDWQYSKQKTLASEELTAAKQQMLKYLNVSSTNADTLFLHDDNIAVTNDSLAVDKEPQLT